MIFDKIKKWYRGDDGEPEFNFEFQVYEYKKQPKRHWLAKWIGFIVGLWLSTWRAILRNPNLFITQLFALTAIFLSATSIYLQFYKDDDKYQSCSITHTDKNTVNIKCKK